MKIINSTVHDTGDLRRILMACAAWVKNEKGKEQYQTPDCAIVGYADRIYVSTHRDTIERCLGAMRVGLPHQQHFKPTSDLEELAESFTNDLVSWRGDQLTTLIERAVRQIGFYSLEYWSPKWNVEPGFESEVIALHQSMFGSDPTLRLRKSCPKEERLAAQIYRAEMEVAYRQKRESYHERQKKHFRYYAEWHAKKEARDSELKYKAKEKLNELSIRQEAK